MSTDRVYCEKDCKFAVHVECISVHRIAFDHGPCTSKFECRLVTRHFRREMALQVYSSSNIGTGSNNPSPTLDAPKLQAVKTGSLLANPARYQKRHQRYYNPNYKCKFCSKEVPLSVTNHYLVCSGLPGTPIKGNIKGCGIKRPIPTSLAKRLAAMNYDFNVPWRDNLINTTTISDHGRAMWYSLAHTGLGS